MSPERVDIAGPGYKSAAMNLLSPPTTPPEPIAVTTNLVKEYGGTRVLDDINLSVPSGVILGLIGPSGCGKTTLVRHLTGMVTPTSGEVRVFGADPAKFAPEARTRFGYMPQQPALFPTLTVWRNLTFMSSVYGMRLRGRRERLHALLDLVDMDDDRRKLLKDCSGGMQRRLMLAATLVHEPELLFLDEPTAGVDPLLRARFWEHFRELRDRGITIVVPTQYVSEAASCDLVAVMSAGRLLAVMTPDDLRRFAFGGDVMVVSLDQDLSRADLHRIAEVPGVVKVSRTDAGVRLVVADAVENGPQIVQAFESVGAPGVVPEVLEPTFEEVFVEIIERDRRESEQAARAA
jgi:ABC-2 type transport system ATP-binding protein